LTTQLNRHFNEQVAKVALQKDPVKKRPTTQSTTVGLTANREISPLDAIYLSITKWRRESRQREMMHPRHSMSPDATVKTSSRVELPELEIPVSDAAQQIETNLLEYVQTGALQLPSVESLGKDVTYAQAHHEKCLTNTIVQEQVDARCTPTAEQVSVYVGPGAFHDCVEEGTYENPVVANHALRISDTDSENEETDMATGTSMTQQIPPIFVSKPCALRDRDKCDVWDAPPALVASPRSTDDTWKSQTTQLFTSNNGFMCGVAVIVAVGMYYSLGLQQHL
jgi:hypothetical protein